MYYHKWRVIIPFLFPAVLIYLIFVVYPYVQAMYISFTRWRGLAAPPEWIGLTNYEIMLADPNFWNALGNNVVYLLAIPAVTIVVALVLAFLVTQGGVRFSNFYRVTFFFPQVMSIVAIGVLWSFVYHPRLGLLNGVLSLFGIDETIAWLGNPDVALGAIAAVVIWQSIGFHMVLFIAGIESIPQSYYDSAQIDGANKWHLFRHITIPLLAETTRTSLIFLAIGAVNMFAITQTMTQGGPNRSTDVLAMYLYERAFTNSRFGYATAIAVSMFLFVLTLTVILRVATRSSQKLEY
jgi:N-acetylglucosamine transport system permease protein